MLIDELFCLEKMIIGMIVEMLALIPSLCLVQFFRRIRPRRHRIFPQNVRTTEVKMWNKGLTFPWWCLFIAYGLSLILVSISILFLIARAIEFGDSKSQKWLISILSGFVSSILVTQPMKVDLFLLR